MAQAIFAALAEDKGVGHQAASAGIAAIVGRGMQEVGIYPEPHLARQVTAEMLGEADLVLAMTPRHVAELRRIAGNSTQNIYTLPEYAAGLPGEGIPDPHGHTMTAYASTLRQLSGYVESAIDRLGS